MGGGYSAKDIKKKNRTNLARGSITVSVYEVQPKNIEKKLRERKHESPVVVLRELRGLKEKRNEGRNAGTNE